MNVLVVVSGVLLAGLTPLYSAVLADALPAASLSVTLSTSHLAGHTLGLSITGWLMAYSLEVAVGRLILASVIFFAVLICLRLLPKRGVGTPRLGENC